MAFKQARNTETARFSLLFSLTTENSRATSPELITSESISGDDISNSHLNIIF